MSARDDIHRLFESGATSYRLDGYLAAHGAEVITALAAKLDGRLKLTEHKTVSKDAIRRFLQLEASAARAAATATTTPAADAPSPEVAADTTRRAHLLADMTRDGGHWKSGTVVRWYKANGYEGHGIPVARHDLAVLRDSGALVQHDEKDVRYFTAARSGGGRG